MHKNGEHGECYLLRQLFDKNTTRILPIIQLQTLKLNTMMTFDKNAIRRECKNGLSSFMDSQCFGKVHKKKHTEIIQRQTQIQIRFKATLYLQNTVLCQLTRCCKNYGRDC